MADAVDWDVIAEKARKATPGPYRANVAHNCHPSIESDAGSFAIFSTRRGSRWHRTSLPRDIYHARADAAYIAALSPEVVLAMCAERERLKLALDRSRGCIKGLLARTPVRDVSETLAEIDAALNATGARDGQE